MWKTVIGIMKQLLNSGIDFHNTFHGLLSGQVMGAASLKANLIQHLMAIRGDVIYEIFLDLHKSYGALDWEICLNILGIYGVPSQAFRLLRTY